MGIRSLQDDEEQPLGTRGHSYAERELWRSADLSDAERWIIKMAIGYFSVAEGIVGDNIQHVTRELVTAPELKLASDAMPTRRTSTRTPSST